MAAAAPAGPRAHGAGVSPGRAAPPPPDRPSRALSLLPAQAASPPSRGHQDRAAGHPGHLALPSRGTRRAPSATSGRSGSRAAAVTSLPGSTIFPAVSGGGAAGPVLDGSARAEGACGWAGSGPRVPPTPGRSPCRPRVPRRSGPGAAGSGGSGGATKKRRGRGADSRPRRAPPGPSRRRGGPRPGALAELGSLSGRPRPRHQNQGQIRGFAWPSPPDNQGQGAPSQHKIKAFSPIPPAEAPDK